uniref:Cytochrome b6-f complex subunit 6 n=1 Tax=Protohalopteris sp. TaxID=2843287 RepID=A0A8F0JX06_9PHAE|nr:cytochrome f [Protohalopteris sp.]
MSVFIDYILLLGLAFVIASGLFLSLKGIKLI